MGDMIARGLAKQSLEKGENLTAQLADTTRRLDGVSINALFPPIPFVGAKADGNYYDKVNKKYYKDEAMKNPSTDNKPVFQALVNHLKSKGGGTILVPEGNFVFRSMIHWETKVSMIGSGAGSTKLLAEGVLFSIIQNTDGEHSGNAGAEATIWLEDVTLRDFEMNLIGLTHPSANVDGKGLFILYMKRSKILNLYVHDAIGTGIGCDFLADTIIDGCIVERCGRNFGIGDIAIGQSGIGIGSRSLDSEPVTVTNNFCIDNGNFGIFVETQGGRTLGDDARIVNNYCARNRIGFGNRGSGSTLIQGNSAVFNKIGIESSQTALGSQILDNKVNDNVESGIFISGNHTYDVEIRGNKIKRNKVGIQFEYGAAKLKQVMVTDNFIKDSLLEGVLIDRQLRNFTLNSNQVLTNAKSKVVDRRSGIQINQNLEVFTINDNICGDDDGTDQINSIKVKNGILLTDGVVSGNNFPKKDVDISGAILNNVVFDTNNGINSSMLQGKLILNGTNYAKVPADVGKFTGTDDFIIETKVKLNSGVASRTIISKTNTEYVGATTKPRGWILRTNSTGLLILEGQLTDGGTSLVRTGTALTANTTYWIRVTSEAGIVKLYISTDGVNFNIMTLTATSGTDSDIRLMFNNDLNVDTMIGQCFLGTSGYSHRFNGEIHHIKVGKGTSNFSIAPNHYYPFTNYGINQSVIDNSYGANGQAYYGAVQQNL